MEVRKKPFYSFVKRLFDFIVSLLFVIVFSPFSLVIMLIISLSDMKGKPIFVQDRVAKNGKIFKLYKFRTMCIDAEDQKASLREQNEADGPAFKIKDDPRITKIGGFLRKTNIDELPQMINILIGNMSFVGPRPTIPEEVAQYSETDKLRQLVTPGLTCYWQASKNRNDIPFDEWMALDRKYIEDRGFLLDLKLIFRTIAAVFKDRDGR